PSFQFDAFSPTRILVQSSHPPFCSPYLGQQRQDFQDFAFQHFETASGENLPSRSSSLAFQGVPLGAGEERYPLSMSTQQPLPKQRPPREGHQRRQRHFPLHQPG